MADVDKKYQDELNQVNQTMKYDGLSRIYLLRKVLKQMEKGTSEPTVIRVSGTNGKGSTIKMINNILQAARYNVGLFTSPYLLDPREQIQINNQWITHQQFLDAEGKVKDCVHELGMNFLDDISEFESWFLIAIQAYLDERIDFILLECGMGGELDATNGILHSDYSLFTLIGLDHFKFLGDTIEKIATTKVKMIRENEKVISYDYQRPQVQSILEDEVNNKRADLNSGNEITFDQVDFDSKKLEYNLIFNHQDESIPINLRLLGDFQLDNLKTVLRWWEVFNQDNQQITSEALVKGIRNTQIVGRFSLIENGFILDGAHNRDAVSAFVQSVNDYFAELPKVIIVGFLADKEVEVCVDELQGVKNATFVPVTPDNHERALSANKLANIFTKTTAIKEGTNRVKIIDNFDQAIEFGEVAKTEHNDTKVFIMGSFYTIRAFEKRLRED